jgi:hypothetical protein
MLYETVVTKLAKEGGAKNLKAVVDHDLIYWMCNKGLPSNLLDSTDFRRMMGHLNSRYKPPSSTHYEDALLPAECAYVERETLAYLRTQDRLTISWDAGTIGNGKSNVHCTVTTECGRSFLFAGKDGSAFSHTGEWYYQFLRRVSLDEFHISQKHI